MLIPSKHINFSSSLLGFGGYILSLLKNSPKSIDQLWFHYQKDNNCTFYKKHNFDNLIKTLIFLYSINLIEEEEGVIKCI